MCTPNSLSVLRSSASFLSPVLLGLSFAATSGAIAKDIVIAQIAPLTGVQAVAGKAYAAGLRLGFDAINATGGISGSLVRLASVDNAYKPEDAVRLARGTIARENPVAFAATVGTANANALINAGVMTSSGIPLIGQSGVFVTKASYADEVNQLFLTLNSKGLTRVAVLFEDDGYGP